MLVSLLCSSLLTVAAHAQLTSVGTTVLSVIPNPSISVPTGTYLSLTTQIILSGSSTSTRANATGARNGTGTFTTSAAAVVTLVGVGGASNTTVGTAVSTSSSTPLVNVQPCNGYPQFCNRKYSNITQVCSHNSAFAKAGNAASNQQYGIVVQLNDGVRMIQGETHLVNNTMYSCHTSCDLLNAGTLENELATVAAWVEQHPYDVVTILLVNSDFVDVHNYTAPIMNAGLGPYLYYPPKVPMYKNDWPTLAEMIVAGKRVVVFMDYQANQAAVPYILDQYSHMWETPFSPVDPAFPCTIGRPPGLSANASRNLMYLANHNLNVQVSIASFSILIPNTADLVEVNGVSGNASLGLMASNCRSDWGSPPNFLVVDYYNYGNGSVFDVAAIQNNVTYSQKCCGLNTAISGATTLTKPAFSTMALVSALVAYILFV